MVPTHSNIVIIGAGPAGLAVAGCLRRKKIPFEIFEKASQVGDSWHNHYDRLHLHTVKSLSGLPHLPLPDDYPQYASRQQVVDYLEKYADHFDIRPHFGIHVERLLPNRAHWELKLKNKSSIEADHVVVATGVNRNPHVPSWPDQDSFAGKIIHSCDYKNPGDTIGKRVLVIGMGNTGAEIALDLAEHQKTTFLSVRNPVSIVPRDINGRPTQLTAQLLEKLPFNSGEWIGNQIRKIVIGNISKYGIKQSKMSPAKQLKETGKTPVLDIGTVKMIKTGKIKVIPDVDRFYSGGVITKDDMKHQIDSIILATGYQAALGEFLENTTGLLDKYAVPISPIGEGAHTGLYFVGFDNYKLGGILGTIRTDAHLVVEIIERKLSGKESIS